MQYYYVNGMIKKLPSIPKSTIGIKSFNKLIREILNIFHVANVDDCCPIDPTQLPVKYNKTAGQLQYFDNITKTWTLVP